MVSLHYCRYGGWPSGNYCGYVWPTVAGNFTTGPMAGGALRGGGRGVGGYHQDEQVGEVNTLLSIAGEGEDTFQSLVQDRTEEIRYKWRRSPIVQSQTLQKASWLLTSKLN